MLREWTSEIRDFFRECNLNYKEKKPRRLRRSYATNVL